MFPYDMDDKENYDPVLKTYSPKRLVNQKRYRVLRSIVLGNKKSGNVGSWEISKDADCTDKDGAGAENSGAFLEFVDESVRLFGL